MALGGTMQGDDTRKKPDEEGDDADASSCRTVNSVLRPSGTVSVEHLPEPPAAPANQTIRPRKPLPPVPKATKKDQDADKSE